MPNQNISLTGFDPQFAAIQRQQRIADLLAQQASAPIDINSGGGVQAPINPLAILAKGLQGYAGSYLERKAEGRAADLQTGYRKELADKLGAFYQTPGSPGMPATPPQQTSINATAPVIPGAEAPEQRSIAATIPGQEATAAVAPHPTSTQDQLAAALQMMGSGNPYIADIAPTLMANAQKRQDVDYQHRLGREDKTWEAAQPMPVARGQEIAAQSAATQDNARAANLLPPTAYQQGELANSRATLAETRNYHQTSGEFGKSMNGRSYSILASGLKNPEVRSTPEYAAAWQILSNPHVDANTGTIVTPDLSAFAPPVGANGAAPQQRMPGVTAFAPPNPSQADAASAGYANRLSESSKLIGENQGALSDLNQRMRSGVPVVGNYLVSPEYQKGDQAERNFINAQLRRESGAAIAESEFANARKQYIPQPGDSKAVLDQKKAAREMAVRNMQLSAGNTLLPPGVFQRAAPPRGAPMVPQQQGFGQDGGSNNDPLGLRR